MKIFPLIAVAAAALVMPAAASAAPAAAQHVRVSINDHHGGRHGWHNVCTTQWRHHRRVRTCHRTRW
jgi:Spy/CpxP family protein refolding chaperone